MPKKKKTKQDLQMLLRDAVLIHDWAHITPDRKMGDKIFKAKDGTIIAEIYDSTNRLEPFALIELNIRQYRATVEVNSWMPDACTAEGKKKAAENLKALRKSRKTASETNVD